ncbi:MAG: serine hydrolase [Acidobacteria bacterium]|nr:serine hydrolase [Acidobacteriota bacterium]
MRITTAQRLTLLAICSFLTFGFNLNNCGGGGGTKQDPLDKVCQENECLSIAEFSKRMQDALNGNTVGYALTVSYGGLLRDSAAAGLGRTASDPPQKEFKTSDRMNVASVNKTVTAVAVLKSLAANNLTVDEKIKTHLPGDWKPGANVGDLTFKDLLTHATGFREANGSMPNGNNTGYNDLKQFVERDLKPADRQKDFDCSQSADKSQCYKNQDFALFRLIIPYLNGFKEAGVTDKGTALGAAYLDYLDKNIFAPMSIKNVGCAPDKKSPTLFYPFPAGTINGTDFGDWTAGCGAGGIHLSADDLATFLAQLRHTNALLDETQRKQMNDDLLGWQNVQSVKHGTCRWHGGYLFVPTAGGVAQDNDFIMDCDNGMQVTLLSNSPMPGGQPLKIVSVVFAAYDASWHPK